MRARGRHNGDTERWQGDAEQSAALEKLSVRVPRSVLSPGHASPAGCAVGSPTPDHVTAEAAAAAGDQWGKEEGVGASMSRWEQGDDDEQLDYDMDDEPMEDNSKDPQDNMLESRYVLLHMAEVSQVSNVKILVSPDASCCCCMCTHVKSMEPSFAYLSRCPPWVRTSSFACRYCHRYAYLEAVYCLLLLGVMSTFKLLHSLIEAGEHTHQRQEVSKSAVAVNFHIMPALLWPPHCTAVVCTQASTALHPCGMSFWASCWHQFRWSCHTAEESAQSQLS